MSSGYFRAGVSKQYNGIYWQSSVSPSHLSSQWFLGGFSREVSTAWWRNHSCSALLHPKMLTNFFVTAFRSYNSHTIKFIFWKYTIQWSLVYSESCNHHHHLILEHSHHPTKKVHTHSSYSPFLPPASPWEPLICFLCAYIFWTFHLNGITQYVAIMLSKFIHVIAYVGISFPFNDK